MSTNNKPVKIAKSSTEENNRGRYDQLCHSYSRPPCHDCQPINVARLVYDEHNEEFEAEMKKMTITETQNNN